MRELTMRRGAGPIDEAAFDARLQQAAERVVAAGAADGTGARVVVRLRAAPRRHGVAIGLGGAAAVACAALLAMLWLPAQRDVPSSSSTRSARAAVTPVAAPADRPEPAGATDVPSPRPDDAVALAGAAQILTAPGARRRQRASVREVPVPADDPSVVALLPVDALALETLDPVALDLSPEP